MLETFEKRPLKRYIFDDFEKMDDRQKNYTRKMYEYVLQQQQQQQIYSSYNYNKINPTKMIHASQMNQMQHSSQQIVQNPGLSLNSLVKSYAQQSQFQQNMIPIPPQIMRQNPLDMKAANNLGFQMNPVSKNRKK